jgi:hypothetical protein
MSSSSACPCPPADWRGEVPHPPDALGALRTGLGELACACPLCVVRNDAGKVTDLYFTHPSTGERHRVGECPSSSSSSRSSGSASSISIISLGSSSRSSSSSGIRLTICELPALVTMPFALAATVISQVGALGCDQLGTGGWPTGSAFSLFYDRSFRVQNAAATAYNRYWLWKAVQPPPPAADCTTGGATPCACCDIYFFVREFGTISGGVDEPANVASGFQFADAIDEAPPDFFGSPGSPFVECPVEGGTATRQMVGGSNLITCAAFIGSPVIVPSEHNVTVGPLGTIFYLCCPSFGAPTDQNGVRLRVEAL